MTPVVADPLYRPEDRPIETVFLLELQQASMERQPLAASLGPFSHLLMIKKAFDSLSYVVRRRLGALPK